MVHTLTSTIDWCEENFVYHDEVAEWWNSTSALVYIGLGLLGIYNAFQRPALQKEFIFFYICQLMVGVGTMWFHGRLTYEGQMYDEVWMLVLLAHGTYLLCGDKYPRIGYVAALVVIVVSYLHITEGYVALFQITFIASGFALNYIGFKRIDALQWPKERKDNIFYAFRRMFFVTLLGLALWATDLTLCDAYYKHIWNPQLHAIFHIVTAYSLYGYGVCFYVVMSPEEGHFHDYVFGLLPAFCPGSVLRSCLKKDTAKAA